MRSICVTFRSVTPAQRGERILRAAGVDCSVQRTPRWMEERGCGYCLRLQPQVATRAVQLLQKGGISFSKVLAFRDKDDVEEMAL